MMHRFDYYDAMIFSSVRFIQNFLHRQTIQAEMIKIIQSRDDRAQFAQLLCFYCANLKCFNEKKSSNIFFHQCNYKKMTSIFWIVYFIV